MSLFSRIPSVAGALAIMAAGFSSPAHAQGADVAKAKAEGRVVIYTSNRSEIANEQGRLFEKKYGIRVETLRLSSQSTKERVYNELRGGRISTDLTHVVDVAFFEDLRKKGVLQPFKTAYFDRLAEPLRDPDGYWLANRITIVTMAYNTDKVKTPPTSWRDLTRPEYLDKTAVGDPNYGNLPIALAAALSSAKDFGWGYFEAVGKTRPLLFGANTQGVQWLATGERLIGVTTDYDAITAINAGDPIKLAYPVEGVVPVPGVTAILKDAPHPNAARLFAEWLLSDEGQASYVEGGQYGARSDVKPPAGLEPLSSLKLLPVDWEKIETNAADIKARYIKAVTGK